MYLRSSRNYGGCPELDMLNAALVQAYRTFNSVSDSTVTDACIFEINALRARRNALLRRLREEEQKNNAPSG